jgi:hypothetical protein
MKLLVVKVVLATFLSIASLSLWAETYNSSDNSDKTTVDSHSVYPANFFDQYTPQNAMAMIKRLPGFSFDSGSQARGFGGNAGNVLIDGVRPTSKSGGLEGALERIPASQVLRIEILRGGVGAGEAAGQAVVANVIKKDTETSGTWDVKFVRAPNGVFKPQVEVAMAMKFGAWDTLFDAEIAEDPEYRTIDREIFNANNILTSYADETLESLDKDISINGEGSREFAGGKLTINTALSGKKWESETAAEKINASSAVNTEPDEVWLLNENKKNTIAELGIDWVKTLADWKLRVIALTSFDDRQYENNFHSQQQDTQYIESSQYTKDTQQSEQIARMTYGRIRGSRLKPEFGVEIAKNRLESELELIENGEQQALEGADVVEELRGEIFANFVYTFNSDLTLEGALTAEFSEIKAYSEINKSKKFNFLKPRLSANYTINDSSTLTLVAEHVVEQLDFNDFAASSDTSEDRTTSGNDNLEPEQVTSFSAIYDWRFSERGSLNVEAVYELRKGIHEQIFLPSGNEGLGNAGDADLWYIKTNLSLPVDAILDNGLLELYYVYKGSDFYDPRINDRRNIYNYIPHYLKVDLRQDVINYDFSWGLQYKHYYEKTRYYVDEVQTNEGNDRLSSLFIETTKFLKMKIRLEVKDVNVAIFTRTRNYYQTDRSGLFEGSEISYRERAPEVNLTFSGTF